MIAKDYRQLKLKGVAELMYQGDDLEYRRKKFNSSTGDEETELRMDVVSILDLQNQRVALILEIADIDELIIDVTVKMDEKAAELKALPEAPK